MDRKLRRDLKTLARFVEIACRDRHADAVRTEVSFQTHDLTAIAGRPVVLCDECRKLLAHAFAKRSMCPMNPKPACKHCPQHCYHPVYRQGIREVMKYSGRRLLLRGRIDYLVHLLF